MLIFILMEYAIFLMVNEFFLRRNYCDSEMREDRAAADSCDGREAKI